MNAEQAKKLREPFPPEQIGKLPKLSCKKCSESPAKVCSEHKKQRCATCGNYISTAHIDLDYVGHAATSDRLLQVDPEWTWKPMAVGPNGEPLITNGGMWIELTVCGVTRPGFGDGKNPKEVIGDAIRNAAMRFGVALDLWAKEDLSGSDERTPVSSGGAKGEPTAATKGEPPTAGGAAAVPQAAQEDEPASPSDTPFTDQFQNAKAKKEGTSTPAQQKQIGDLIVELAKLRGTDVVSVTDALEADAGGKLNDLTAAEADTLIGKLKRWQRNLEKAAAAA